MTISQHQKPIPSGLTRPEPAEVLAACDLDGKTALVTGGYSGIGLETVRALVAAGAHVHVPARDKTRACAALEGIIPDSQISEMDLGDLSSVRKFTDDFGQQHGKIDILIANAGVMACPERNTVQGLEYQLGVNHFGHFVLINGLLKQLAAAGNARVVALSSVGHRISAMRFDDPHFKAGDYEKWTAYGQSKTAQSLMAVELDRRGTDQGIRAFGVHPGGIFTPLQRHLPNAEMAALGWTKEDGSVSDTAAQIFKTPTQGCATSLWAATSAQLDGLGGVYCEDCDIARQVAADDAGSAGVRPWAVDQEDAARLWQMTEETLAEL